MSTPPLTPEEFTRSHSENGGLDAETVNAFQTLIRTHYHQAGRTMPWRETRDPYAILVSEIMLQQTQVERVKLKYAEFLDMFPRVQELAAAPLASVLKTWQGLGYNRRAMFLKRCAETIVSEHSGLFPASVADLEALPGIGHYTARAVAAFAFGIAEPMIETNIRTVYLHFFYHGHEQVHDRDIMPLITQTLDRAKPRDWYYALMDYGALLKQMHPNPGRQSRHHQLQGRFEGSNRQLRSKLLRAVLEHPGISRTELLAHAEGPREQVLKNLEALQAEGFLIRQGKTYSVAGETKRGKR